MSDLRERALLERYLELLYSASQRLNLTRIPRSQAWARHIDEALDLIPLRQWTVGESVLDLGSGGGIPGIPLAISQPGVSLGLIERDRAKATFLVDCAARLGLASVQVLALDALELARRPGFRAADVLVSRAALPLPRLLRVASRLLRVGGEGLVHVGESAALTDEVVRAAGRVGISDLHLESSGSSRVLRFIKLRAGSRTANPGRVGPPSIPEADGDPDSS
ncbi:MAG: RsmG family class I SAM-dependent methyltransferase [Candidatus Dormiibacterota bacterium]